MYGAEGSTMSTIIHCPYCHSDKTVLIGLVDAGLFSYKCDYCGNRWSRTAADDAPRSQRKDEPER
jgi:transposase-like protein